MLAELRKHVPANVNKPETVEIGADITVHLARRRGEQ
jgi:hypothetical protein